MDHLSFKPILMTSGICYKLIWLAGLYWVGICGSVNTFISHVLAYWIFLKESRTLGMLLLENHEQCGMQMSWNIIQCEKSIIWHWSIGRSISVTMKNPDEPALGSLCSAQTWAGSLNLLDNTHRIPHLMQHWHQTYWIPCWSNRGPGLGGLVHPEMRTGARIINIYWYMTPVSLFAQWIKAAHYGLNGGEGR